METQRVIEMESRLESLENSYESMPRENSEDRAERSLVLNSIVVTKSLLGIELNKAESDRLRIMNKFSNDCPDCGTTNASTRYHCRECGAKIREDI